MSDDITEQQEPAETDVQLSVGQFIPPTLAAAVPATGMVTEDHAVETDTGDGPYPLTDPEIASGTKVRVVAAGSAFVARPLDETEQTATEAAPDGPPAQDDGLGNRERARCREQAERERRRQRWPAARGTSFRCPSEGRCSPVGRGRSRRRELPAGSHAVRCGAPV
jgi:hypothetical protein